MNIVTTKVSLNQWINANTAQSKSVVELGAMFCEKLRHVHENVQTKIGVEIWEPYIKAEFDHFGAPVYKDCIRIHGNVLDYKNLLKNHELDTAMIIDVLEHFDKEVAFEWFESLKKDFKKILLMVPAGVYPQDTDHTGLGAHEYQTHRSSWFDKDINKLGFDEVALDPTYHSNPELIAKNMDTGVWFCIWVKKEDKNDEIKKQE